MYHFRMPASTVPFHEPMMKLPHSIQGYLKAASVQIFVPEVQYILTFSAYADRNGSGNCLSLSQLSNKIHNFKDHGVGIICGWVLY
jgi:hypothetical protein